MSDQTTQTNTQAPVAPTQAAPAAGTAPFAGRPSRGGPSSSSSDDFKKNRRPSRRRREAAPRSEFEQKILDIRRVTRVSSGGRRFSFSVAMVIGNRKGKVGVGTGKGGDTSLAIEKAVKNAKKSLIEVKTVGNMSIPHQSAAKYCSAEVTIFPAPGRGVIAGSALRDVLEFAGLSDINGKIISGTKNKLNIAQAAVKALKKLETPREVKGVKRAAKAGDKPAAEAKVTA